MDAAMDAMKNETILQIAGLKVAYGGIKAVKGIDLQVARGELVTLIGANGAGKTTTLKAITGTLPPCKVEGDISYLGQPLRGTQSFRMVQQKLAMVPEGRGVFTRMSIHENLLMGAYTRNDKAGIDADIEKWYAVFPRLKERAGQLAGTLSGGEQQMLAMARADVPSDAAVAGRTVDGLVADHGRKDFRGDPRCVAAGHHDPAGRAERQAGAGGRAPWLCDGVGRDHHDGQCT
jgi:ABC-type sugar transport system ATPase subunit